ncbi:MAG: tRNA uridine-5-carboxymethylaminomethyl(34) synthesis GTPase MnmE [Elusimicrobia bacterium]|nr:tRNA uridine-5-carboxymethylaminomethyl(34) synthesis GTPase MnmE [Elusimicrobiota bacterium]
METIAAIATPRGIGALGIARLSGGKAVEIADKFFKSKPSLIDAKPWQALLGRIQDTEQEGRGDAETRRRGDAVPVSPCPRVPVSFLDWAVAIKYAAPKSYTGEDCVEIISHGSAVILGKILALAITHGARQALPGEFTQRAYLNGKIDLLQAEAVCGLIRASSERAARLEAEILCGKLSRRLRLIADALAGAAAMTDALIDHPDEADIGAGFDPEELQINLENIEKSLVEIERTFSGSKKIKEGLRVAIVGAVNAGKSSLLNALLAKDRAIVSPEPGTTRDTIEELLEIDGYLIKLVDTAGWRDAGSAAETIGLERAQQAVRNADLLLWVKDGALRPRPYDGRLSRLIAANAKPYLAVWNKSDLEEFAISPNGAAAPLGELAVSALNGDGIAALKERLKNYWESQAPQNAEVSVTEERQIGLIHCGLGDIKRARENAARGQWELTSLELRHALGDLHLILGEGSVGDEILASIFSKFCIGK